MIDDVLKESNTHVLEGEFVQIKSWIKAYNYRSELRPISGEIYEILLNEGPEDRNDFSLPDEYVQFYMDTLLGIVEEDIPGRVYRDGDILKYEWDKGTYGKSNKFEIGDLETLREGILMIWDGIYDDYYHGWTDDIPKEPDRKEFKNLMRDYTLWMVLTDAVAAVEDYKKRYEQA